MASVGQIPSAAGPHASALTPQPGKRDGRRWVRSLLMAALIAGALGGAWLGALRIYRTLRNAGASEIPTARVQRSDQTLTITARGELQGGNPQTLAAPMTGGTEMHLTYLRKTGEQVKSGDTVVAFDTAEQEFKLKEAQADLAEAEQNLVKAQAQREADQEEDRYALLKAKADLRLAELDKQKNPLLPAITAKQNDLAVEGARDHLAQTEKNLSNRRATGEAGVAIQQAAKAKAEAQATTAQQNIAQMTLRATRPGYVAIKTNTSTNFFFTGMTLPFFQVGDTVRPGMAVAEIPDMRHWEVSVNVGELDRGHLKPGDKVSITVVALANHLFHGHVKQLGGMTGPFWNRHFECNISLDDPMEQLRPGMSASIVVTTDELKGVLSLPAQALFESDGKTFAYVRTGGTFVARNIRLVRRSETRAVVEGLKEGEVVALANPVEITKKKDSKGSPLETVGK